jgi:hypothetical protein
MKIKNYGRPTHRSIAHCVGAIHRPEQENLKKGIFWLLAFTSSAENASEFVANLRKATNLGACYTLTCWQTTIFW